MTSPRKGTETLQALIAFGVVEEKFEMTSPRKGTETPHEINLPPTMEWFEMTSPRKGTETPVGPRMYGLYVCQKFEMTSPRKGTETPAFHYLSFCHPPCLK